MAEDFVGLIFYISPHPQETWTPKERSVAIALSCIKSIGLTRYIWAPNSFKLAASVSWFSRNISTLHSFSVDSLALRSLPRSAVLRHVVDAFSSPLESSHGIKDSVGLALSISLLLTPSQKCVLQSSAPPLFSSRLPGLSPAHWRQDNHAQRSPAPFPFPTPSCTTHSYR